MSVLLSEALGNRTEADKPESFVKMAGVNIGCNDSIELKYRKAAKSALLYTVKNELLTDMPAAH